MSGSGEWMRASGSRLSTISDGSPRRDLVGLPIDADDVAEVHVDGAGAVGGAEQLDAARAVDEVEEDELPHLAPREHAAREAALLGPLVAGLERAGLGVDGGDLVAVGKALRPSSARV